MAVVEALWDSWAEDAVIDDRKHGRYAKPERIRPINHKGNYYQVAGPLNLPRTPQGRPVFVQAGSSDTGRRFAARHAEAVGLVSRSSPDCCAARAIFDVLRSQHSCALGCEGIVLKRLGSPYRSGRSVHLD